MRAPHGPVVVAAAVLAAAAASWVPRAVAAGEPWIKPAPAAAVAAITEAIAKADPRVPAGSGRVVARIEKGDPAKDGAAIRDELQKAGFTVLDERGEPGLFVVTLEARTGARVRIALDAHQGAITLVARPARTTPPGACVPIPSIAHSIHVHSTAIDQRGQLRRGETSWSFQTLRLLDIDGDGLDDAFVPIGQQHACPEDVAWRVYAVRGACGHDLGIVGPGSIDPAAAIAAPLDASGFRPLVVTSETSKPGQRMIPERTTTRRWFEVRRGSYTQIDVKAQTGVCHHCATWYCRAP